jgi:predicted nucleic acid-binding protein
VILADASVWIEFFRSRMPALRRLLESKQIVMHPCLVAELALGSLQDREFTLAKLDSMPMLRLVDLRDVRRMIEARSLWSKGIGLTDAHLLASCLVTPGTQLWTTDVRLGNEAERLGLRVTPS